jgi:tetratricopeptide (TPR) repeat protein
MLKTLFGRVPYIDENVAVADYVNVSNVALSNDQLWDKLAEDFQFAADNLPVNQPEVGRATQLAAKAYLAKVRLYQAYTQNETHQVTGVDQGKLQEVLRLTDEVMNGGRYSLYSDFGSNFMSSNDNGSESVFAIQFSKNDGTIHGRIAQGNKLNYPMNSEFGCCGFHQPSQNLVNSFRTGPDGLPLFTSFNDVDIATANDFSANTMDPRVDHTVAVPGHPWKYDPNFVMQQSWVRVPNTYGYFQSLKENVGPNDASFQREPPFMSSTKNIALIRYADVLLWRAEALIELGRHAEALPLINQIRERAQNSTGLLVSSAGQPVSNYAISLYNSASWTQEYARQALRFERRLEFAMEGFRFFDLVRWGIAAPYMNNYFAVEKTKRQYLQDAQFTAGRDEYLPIPLNQINYSKGLYKQNPGW